MNKGVVGTDADMDKVLATLSTQNSYGRMYSTTSTLRRREALLKLIERAMDKAAYRGTATDEPVIDVFDEEDMEAEVVEESEEESLGVRRESKINVVFLVESIGW